MKYRISTVLAATLVGLGLVASDAFAHGGQFRGPHGSVPPGLRAPSDPTPPPPSPTPTPSGPITPGTGGPNPSVPDTPNTGGAGHPPISGSPTGKTTGKRAPLDFSDASFWWGYNGAPYMELKKAIYHRVSSDNPISYLGGSRGRNDSTHDVRALTRTTLIPAMRWAMDAKNKLHADIESASYIGLAKVTSDPEHIELLRKGLALGKGQRDIMVQEAAALSFGLLRRVDKSEQFLPVELDRVRSFLFNVFENEDYGVRVRGFAALSIGLLGDQPSGQKGVSDGMAAGQTTTKRLFDLLKSDYTHPDLAVSLLMSIGMQDPRSITREQRDVLSAAVLKRKLYDRECDGILSAHAAHTLGRVGTKSSVRVLQHALRQRSGTDLRVVQSAAIGLGELSERVSATERVALVDGMLKTVQKRLRETSARGFSYISMAYAIAADIKAGASNVVDETKADEFLLREALKGRAGHRNYAGLALAIIARAIGEEPSKEIYGNLRSSIFETLGVAIETKKFSKRERANFAVAVGMAGAKIHANVLHKIVRDRDESHELRGYAALSLGLLNDTRRGVISSIRDALADRRSEEMRIQCATALGLLHDKDAVPLLVEELERARTASAKGQVVLALARIGDARAIEPLVNILRDKDERALTRAVSCAALGIVGDMEPIPSLSRISIDVNYRASTDLSREVLSIL